MPSRAAWLLVLLGVSAGCSRSVTVAGQPAPSAPGLAAADAELYARCQMLAPLHQRPPAVTSGDWLDEHAESGQTFAQYLAQQPIVPAGERRTIYVLPIGAFDGARRQVLERTAEALSVWFGLPAKVEAPLPLEAIPGRAQRRFPHGGWLQLRTGYLMEEVLRPGLAADAACRIGFCTADLWPGAGWNFVFGEASLVDRVGVWSLYRDGDPERSAADFRLCLLRALKTATHEIAHMFGMHHCTAWSCNLAGANHQQESDRQPWRLCPECLAKLLWATGADADRRFTALVRFTANNGLAGEHEWFVRASERWRSAR